MRILLAAEGESDEVVAHRLLLNVFPDAAIQPKRLPARGIKVLERLLTDFIRAAHFGFFDLLVLHFDLDDTFQSSFEHVNQSERWQAIRKEVDDLLATLPLSPPGRASALTVVFMTPAQSTDAWLRWAVMNGDGKKWEVKDRLELKKQLYGDPPRGLVKKSISYVDRLIAQMGECALWPRSLRDFQGALESCKANGRK